MSSDPFMKRKIKFFLVLYVLQPLMYYLVRGYSWTFRFEVENEQAVEKTLESGGVVILACWHQQFFSAIRHFRKFRSYRPCIMISPSQDGSIVADLARRTGLRSVVVRLFNTIGPRQVGRYGMVVPRFVTQAVAGKDLTLYGDGQQTRAFCDVRDVVGALAELIEHQDAYGRVFNVGSTTQITIEQLADRVIEQVAAAGGPRVGKTFVSYEAVYGEGFEDPPHRLPDMTRLRDAIGFRPKVDLAQTLRELIAAEQTRISLAESSSGTGEAE